MTKATAKDWRNFVLIWCIGLPLAIWFLVLMIRAQ